MNYIELEHQLVQKLHLERGSVFILKLNKHGNLLEFDYPTRLRGNFIPVNAQSIAGRSIINRRPFLSNHAHGERDATFLNCLSRFNGTYKIQKMLTHPILCADSMIGVIQIIRKGETLSQAKNFHEEDLEKVKRIIENTLDFTLAESA